MDGLTLLINQFIKECRIAPALRDVTYDNINQELIQMIINTPDHLNDHSTISLLTILNRFTEILALTNSIDTFISMDNAKKQLLVYLLISRYSIVKYWKQPNHFDLCYCSNSFKPTSIIIFNWFEDHQQKIDEFKDKANLFNDMRKTDFKPEYYLVSFKKLKNENNINIIKFEIQSFTMYFSIVNIINCFKSKISESLWTKFTENINFFESKQIKWTCNTDRLENANYYNNFKTCLKETLNGVTFEVGEIKLEHILLFYLSTLNQFGKIQNWTEVQELSIKDTIDQSQIQILRIKYKSFNLIKCEYIMFLDEITANPIESRKVKIVIHNLREASFVKDCERRLVLFCRNQDNKIEYKCEIFKEYKPSKYYQNVLKYEHEFDGFDKNLENHFKNINKEEFIKKISNYEMVCITINNESHLIDVHELNNTLKRYTSKRYRSINVLSNKKLWEDNLKPYEPSRFTFESEIPNITFEGIQLFVYDFIKTHNNRMKKTIYDMTHLKYKYKEELFGSNIVKIEELIKNLLGFADKDALDSYSNECKNPIDIVNEFNRLSREHQNMAFSEYNEIHFHLLFLILLAKSKHVKEKEWHSDMQCTRLSTFIQTKQNSVKKSSTGYCDLFYVDNENKEYLIELKYLKNNENLDLKKTEAIDQARSYQIENRPEAQCFAIIFLLKNKNLFCHMFYDESNLLPYNGFQAYKRQSKIKQEKNLIVEIKNCTDFSKTFLKENDFRFTQTSNENERDSLNYEFYCIDANEFKYLYSEETDLNIKEFWKQKFMKLNPYLKFHAFSICSFLV